MVWIETGNLFAQVSPSDIRTHSTMLGVGSVNQLDTYLSPYEYIGTQWRLIQENRRPTTLLQGKVSMQNLLQANFAQTDSPSQDADYLSGMLEWNIALHYCWQIAPNLQILAGPQFGAHAGFIYNSQGGNNPAQGRLSADFGASGMALYNFHIGSLPFQARYQIDLPLVGVMFSPQYGQSYYEMFSLAQTNSHNVCVTSPFAALTLNQMATVDCAFRSSAIRIGVNWLIRQSEVNHLKVHDWSVQFLVGYVRKFTLVKKS